MDEKLNIEYSFFPAQAEYSYFLPILGSSIFADILTFIAYHISVLECIGISVTCVWCFDLYTILMRTCTVYRTVVSIQNLASAYFNHCIG